MSLCPGTVWVVSEYLNIKVKDPLGNCTTVRCRKGRRVHKRYLKQLEKQEKTDGRRD